MFISLLISFKTIRIYFRRFLKTKFKQNLFWRCICTELIDIHLRLRFEPVDLRKTIYKCLQPGQISQSDYFFSGSVHFVRFILFWNDNDNYRLDFLFMKRKTNRKERKQWRWERGWKRKSMAPKIKKEEKKKEVEWKKKSVCFFKVYQKFIGSLKTQHTSDCKNNSSFLWVRIAFNNILRLTRIFPDTSHIIF